MVDEFLMEICLNEARKAFEEDEVPVGAMIMTPEKKILAITRNRTIQENSPTAHAEILAINEAAKTTENYRLVGCTLYVTKEPCMMCAGAIVEARIRRVVFGCYDAKRGGLCSAIDVNKLPLNHKVEITGGMLSEESEMLLKNFFQIRRGTEAVITGPTRNRLYAL